MTRSQRDRDFFLSSEICEIRAPRRFRPPSSFSSCISRRMAEYEPAVVNESGGQVAFPRRTAPSPLSAASTPYSSDTESADAESTPANRNQYHAGLLRRGLLFS